MLLNLAQQTAAAPKQYAFFLVNSVATFLISFLPAVFRPGRLGAFGPVPGQGFPSQGRNEIK